MRLGEAVSEVDVAGRRLRVGGDWLEWDELVFATGSQPFIPSLTGIERPQVFAFRTLADVKDILAIPGPAVVIGGGVLGVEVAAALRRHGGEVTLLHRGSGLMEPLTDAFAAEQLKQQLEARGIHCELESRIAAIVEQHVRLEDGRAFAASRVVLATGVRPDIRLAARSGVACQRGIIVDRRMATSLPGISAIGECCEIDGQTWGLVAPCLRQADVLVERLCGAPGEEFSWQDGGTRLKVTGIEFLAPANSGPASRTRSTAVGTPSIATTVACWFAMAGCTACCCWATVSMRRRLPRCSAAISLLQRSGFLTLL